MNAAILKLLQTWRAEKRACALVTHMTTGRAALTDGTIVSGDADILTERQEAVGARISSDESGMMGDDLFVGVYAPPVRLIIVGAVHIAQSLAPMARLAGLSVTVIDPRDAFIRSAGFAGVTTLSAWPDEGLAQIALDARTAVVTLTHDPKLDDPALTVALRSPAFYVGALGSRKTHAKRVARLKEAGFSDNELVRIHAPIGLDINALTPAEIAVAIMAEIIKTLRTEA